MIQLYISRLVSRILAPIATISALSLLLSGCGGAHFNATPMPTVTIAGSPTSITAGSSSTLTVTATNATAVTVTGTDGSSYTLQADGGTQSVSPTVTTTYTATATGAGGNASANTTVTELMIRTAVLIAPIKMLSCWLPAANASKYFRR